MHRQVKLFYEKLAPTSLTPPSLHVSRAKGPYIYDFQNNKFIDLIAGISVGILGHGHPGILKAVRKQLKRHLHVMVYGEFVQSTQVRLAEKLIEKSPAGADCVYFVNSGSEATELAMKLVRRATGRSLIVSFDNAYHGSTLGALSLMGDMRFQNTFRPLIPGILRLKYNSIRDLDKINTEVAGVFVEVIQGEAGCRVAESDFIQMVRKKCSETGALLVIDEIQTGLGRTGTFWAFEHFNIIPDIILTAKALGGGLPLGAVIASSKLLKELAVNPPLGHITTFGGNPLSCAAGIAVLEVIEKENLLEQALDKEKFIRKYIGAEMDTFLYGKGLLLALKIGNMGDAIEFTKRMYKSRIITDWFLYRDDSIRIAPAINMNQKVMQKAFNCIMECLEVPV